MSTRGLIGRKTSVGSTLAFTARYHHADSYPRGLGAALYGLYHGHFACDMAVMLTFLLDEHPSGWETIVDCDFSLPPGYGAMWRFAGLSFPQYAQKEEWCRPQCFCHGDKSDPEWSFTQDDETWAEWAYIFDEKAGRMAVYQVLVSSSPVYRLVAMVALAGPEPDWLAMEELVKETPSGV